MKMTFKMKSLFIMIPILVVVSLIFTFVSIKTEKEIIRNEIIKRAETITTLATKTGELPILSGNSEQLNNAVSFLRANAEVSSVGFYNSKMGMLVNDGLPIPNHLPALKPDSPISMAEEDDNFIFYAPVFTVKAKDNFDFFVETDNVKVRENIGWIRLGFSKSSMRENERKIVSQGLLLALIFSLGSSALVYFLISLATRPLGRIVAVANDIANGDFSQEIEVDYQDEIGALAKAFYSMKNTIEQVLHETDVLILAVQSGKPDARGHAEAFEGGWRRLVDGVNQLTEAFGKVNAELLESNESLEKRVEERTEELAKANKALQAQISERRHTEEQLRQSQKMEAVGTLAGGIAHDFNNILTAIMGFGGILRMKMGQDSPMIHYIDDINSASEKAARLTQSLLAFSRKQIISSNPENINKIVSTIDNILQRVIGEDVEYKSILADENLIVMADSGQIEQVLMNLAANARDAMPEGGILTILTERVDVRGGLAGSYIKPGSYAVISVSDTGEGMNEATKQRLFEPFFTTKEIGKGTGLGLSIVYGIIKQHNGEINVYSEPGKGTTFKIYLELIESDAYKTATVQSAIPVGGTETVLICEDDVYVRRFMSQTLEEFGYTVIVAVDGEDALNKFKEHKERIQLLIVDVIMPKMHGKDVCEAIRKINKDVRVIFSSGYTADIIHKKGVMEAGAQFISKPVTPHILLSKVREALSQPPNPA
jgi:signal transduction histidine kinase/CheY-like chemotaxis protein